MSKDQEPARSRRALRRAREAQTQAPDAGSAAPSAEDDGSAGRTDGGPARRSVTRPAGAATSPPRRSVAGASADGGQTAQGTGASFPAAEEQQNLRSRRRSTAANSEDDTDAGPAERSSQARARDRQALRAYKELSDKDPRKGEGAPLTRRQLRQQQLDAERSAGGAAAAPPTEATPEVIEPGTAAIIAVEPDGASGDGTKPRSAPRAEPGGESLRAQRGGTGGGAAAADEPTARRASRSRAGAAQKDDALNDLSVEQALAAREALVEQAKNQAAMLNAPERQDPHAVDLEVLAEQRKLAERAAVLNQRAMTKQRLAEESRRQKPVRYDPASTDNLAMVTPLEFIRVPGVDQPVMKAPATSHIPVITSTTERVPAVPVRSKTSTTRRQVPPVTKDNSALSPSVLSGDDPRTATGSRSHVLAQAEAVAQTRVNAPPVSSRSLPRPVRPEPTDEGGPISAHTAHGLEPLDSRTAALAQSGPHRLMQLFILIFGSIALLVVLMMIFGG